MMNNYNLEKFKEEIKSGKRKDAFYFYKRTEEQKQEAVTETKELELFIKKEFNLDIYLIYGTLLGAIRDKNFICYDRDVDVAYLSNYTNKHDVIKEFHIIEERLKNKDLLSKTADIGHLHVWSPAKKLKIDFWTSWIENDHLYLTPVIDGNLDKSSLLPLKLDNFRNVLFNFPNNPQEILTFIYKDWKVPLINAWRKVGWKKII